MKMTLRKSLVFAAAALTMLGSAALFASPANADNLHMKLVSPNGFVEFGQTRLWEHDAHYRGHKRRGHRSKRHHRHGHHDYYRPVVRWCSPERAIHKAWRMGVNHPHIARIGDSRLVVRGHYRGHRAKVVFDRHSRHCPVIKTRGLHYY